MRSSDPGVVLGLYRSRYERDLLEGALKLGVDQIDTSYNYYGFGAHQTLAERAGDLLEHFSISTKVGFFPTKAGRSEHSLQPARLRQAVQESVNVLRTPPQVVFLHNPEHTLARCGLSQGTDLLASACAELALMAREGWCDSWGIASWNPRPLAELVVGEGAPAEAFPPVFMSRAGLTVGARTLEAIETLAQAWKIPPEYRWGMSPFAGHSTDPVWSRVNARAFLEGGPECSNLAAAFRVASALPEVTRVAVGTNQLTHLDELVRAVHLSVDVKALTEYRRLLRAVSPQSPVG